MAAIVNPIIPSPELPNSGAVFSKDQWNQNVYHTTLKAVVNTSIFCFQACVDVRASSVFWQQMELAEAIQGQPKLPEWLSTHPSHENRAEHLDRLIPEVSS